MKQTKIAEAAWRKSSLSGGQACVEVAFLGDAVAVRDSKERGGPVHVFTASGLPSSAACRTGSSGGRHRSRCDCAARRPGDHGHRGDEAWRLVTRHQRPVAALVGIRRLSEIEEAAADLRDLAHVLARSMTDSGRRTSLDDVLATFGHTRGSIAAMDDE
jgi:hypothetical protein